MKTHTQKDFSFHPVSVETSVNKKPKQQNQNKEPNRKSSKSKSPEFS